MDINLLEETKKKITDNINYAKKLNLRKVSAILVYNEEEIQKEILSWLIYESYKVSLIKDDVNILTIEW